MILKPAERQRQTWLGHAVVESQRKTCLVLDGQPVDVTHQSAECRVSANSWACDSGRAFDLAAPHVLQHTLVIDLSLEGARRECWDGSATRRPLCRRARGMNARLAVVKGP